MNVHQLAIPHRPVADISSISFPIKMLVMEQVIEKVGLGRSTIYELISQNQFPKPVQIGGGRAKRFIEVEIDQWLLDQIKIDRTKSKEEGAGGCDK